MTLTQLKYVLAIAKAGTINAAAKQLFISQPTLSSAVKELETELGISLFNRTSKGVEPTADGEEFLSYARQVVMQTDLIEERYLGTAPSKQRFCVSCQHYSFAVEAFVNLIKEHGGSKYDFRIRETQTYEIIEDVSKLRSEVGVLYLNSFNERVIRKTLQDQGLVFSPLFKCKPSVFVGKDNPLAKRPSVTLNDLAPYPRLSYEQGEHNAFYFSEELLATLDRDKDIMVRDRATIFNLIIGLNGYTISTGLINEELNGPNIVAIPLAVDDYMEVGYVTHDEKSLSPFGELYIDARKRCCQAVTWV